MKLRKAVIAIAAITILGIVAWSSEGDAQTVLDSKGAWQISAPTDADSSPEKFVLSTSAFDQAGAKLNLSCRKDVPLYYFAVESPRAVPRRRDEDARFSIRTPNQE